MGCQRAAGVPPAEGTRQCDTRSPFVIGRFCRQDAGSTFSRGHDKKLGIIYGRLCTFASVGKSAGTFCVTWPVAAHSVPRCSVTAKPTHLIASMPWPNAV